MITLYQLHWSHYVEKVRWALDYKKVEWSAVDVDPFTKKQMQHLPSKLTLDSGREMHAVPTIHDHATGTVVSDSSKILDYLESTYPTPELYPSDPIERQEVARWTQWLDSTLGLAARRLAYTQIAVENPAILASLFIPRSSGGATFKARLGGAIIAGVLSRRFRFQHNRTDRVFEKLEQCLLMAGQRLSSRDSLVGERFTAADLTLAALSRPVLLVPYFRDHPRLQRLWEWRTTQLQAHHRDSQVSYEAALHDVRQRRGWALGAVSWLGEQCKECPAEADIPMLPTASNDQQSVGRWPLFMGSFWYLRLKLTCGLNRTLYRSTAS